DATRGAPARDLVRGGWNGRVRLEQVFVALPGAACGPRSCGFRGADARCRAGGALPLAGARAEAAELEGPPVPGAVAGDARGALRAHRRVLASRAHARHGGRVRAPAARLSAR